MAMMVEAEAQAVDFKLAQADDPNVQPVDPSNFQFYTGPIKPFGISLAQPVFEGLELSLRNSTFPMKGFDGNTILPRLNLSTPVVAETIPEEPTVREELVETVHVPWSFGESISTGTIPEEPAETSRVQWNFGDSTAIDSYGFEIHTGLHDSLMSPLDRYVSEMKRLRDQKNPDGSPLDGVAYQQRALRIAEQNGFPVSHETPTRQTPNEAGSLAAAALPFLAGILDRLPRRAQQFISPLVISSILLGACGPRSVQPPEIRPTATERPAIASPIPPTELPTPEPIPGAPMLTQLDIQKLPGLSPDQINGQKPVHIPLTDSLEKTFTAHGLAPVYVETTSGPIVSDEYTIDGTTVVAVPYPQTLFNAEQSQYDTAGNLVQAASDTVASVTGGVVSYKDEGPDRKAGTRDDVVTTQVVTVAGIKNLPQEDTVVLAIVATENNPIGPKSQLRFVVIDGQGDVVGSMPAAVAGDKVVQVDWSNGTVSTTVDSQPLAFTFNPGFQFATETPVPVTSVPTATRTPEITATRTIQPTVATAEATQHVFNTEIPDPSKITLLTYGNGPKTGLPEGVSISDLISEQDFINLFKTIGLDISSSNVGKTSAAENVDVIGVIPLAIERFTDGNYQSIRMWLLGFGPTGEIVFEKDLIDFYVTDGSTPCSVWDGNLALLTHAKKSCDKEKILEHSDLIKGRPMLMSIAWRFDSSVSGADGVKYLAGKLGIVDDFDPLTNSTFKGSNGWGVAFVLDNASDIELLTK